MHPSMTVRSSFINLTRSCLYYVLLLILLPGVPSCSPIPTVPELTPITVQLRWTHQSQFAGFYAADQNGDYAAEGLDVTFLEGGPDVDIHAPVSQGLAQFGVAGAETLILKRAAGIPFRAVATIYRRNPLVFMTLADSGITRPQDFAGKTILVASFNQAILHAMTSHVGVTPDRYDEACCNIDGFYTGEFQVAHAYLTNEVINASKEGHQINIINPDDYGVHFYADTLYVNDDFMIQDPDIIRRFLRATLKGWTYAVENPEAVGPLVRNYNPDVDPDLEAAKMIASIPLVNTGEDFIGWMEPDIWAGMEKTLREQEILVEPLNIEEVYTMQFVEEIYHP